MINISHKEKKKSREVFGFVDLFSGAGGMSCGFQRHHSFLPLAAADAQLAKPSMKSGSLGCNETYAANIGVEPRQLNLKTVDAKKIRSLLGIGKASVEVLLACPPCTGFSRANPQNHLQDDHRNSLVAKVADFALALDAPIVLMENARELLRGNFSCHFDAFRSKMEKHGYEIISANHMLTQFGLPQIRERALVVAVKSPISVKVINDLWEGYGVSKASVTVKKALSSISKTDLYQDRYPLFSSDLVKRRIAGIPRNGGSWIDLLSHADSEELLTDSMKRIISSGRLGSHPDVYGRMAWDKPSPTIKRECAHIGNGRYAHPVKNRLCTVREIATLQGFPRDYVFPGRSLSNKYRQIGDAVPPLISYQLAHLCEWMLTGYKPGISELLLEKTHLSKNDLIRKKSSGVAYAKTA